MATSDSNYSELHTQTIISILRDSWCSLSEIQMALDQDEERFQDRRNRFVSCLAMLVERQNLALEELEVRYASGSD